MNPIVTAGLGIGILCGVWLFVMGVTGWYRDPSLVNLFIPVVSAIEIAGLVWGLRRTAARGRTYSGQVVAGTLMALVAGVVVVASSLVFTTIAFPDYFKEIEAMGREVMQQRGMTEAQIEAELAAAAPYQTPVLNALAGFAGTLITGVLASAVIAIWIRARRSPEVARSA